MGSLQNYSSGLLFSFLIFNLFFLNLLNSTKNITNIYTNTYIGSITAKYNLVFYKTNKLSDQDNKELKNDEKWKAYSIDEIHDFFKDKKTNDEIE